MLIILIVKIILIIFNLNWRHVTLNCLVSYLSLIGVLSRVRGTAWIVKWVKILLLINCWFLNGCLNLHLWLCFVWRWLFLFDDLVVRWNFFHLITLVIMIALSLILLLVLMLMNEKLVILFFCNKSWIIHYDVAIWVVYIREEIRAIWLLFNRVNVVIFKKRGVFYIWAIKAFGFISRDKMILINWVFVISRVLNKLLIVMSLSC